MTGAGHDHAPLAIRSLFVIILISNLQISYQEAGAGYWPKLKSYLAQTLLKNEFIMVLFIYPDSLRIVLFSHNIAMVITMLRKTAGGLLTKDDGKLC